MMKRILRHFVVDTYCLYLTSKVASGMIFQGGFRTLIVAGIALTLVSVFAKPIINLLLLPLNLVTFGLFRWVASGVVLYLVTLIIRDYKIQSFMFPGLQNKWIELPALNFERVLAFIAYSFVLSLLTSAIYWLLKN